MGGMKVLKVGVTFSGGVKVGVGSGEEEVSGWGMGELGEVGVKAQLRRRRKGGGRAPGGSPPNSSLCQKPPLIDVFNLDCAKFIFPCILFSVGW